MKTVGLDEAQTRLSELVDALERDGDVVITRDDQPVARLTSPAAQPSLRDSKPASVGRVLRPLNGRDDLLEEMLGQ